MYIKQVRCILELAVPVWHSSLTSEENLLIERVQKSALRIIYGQNYVDYRNALNIASLVTLEERRVSLCKKFAMKCVKHPKHSKWFVKAKYTRPARVKRNKFLPVRSRTAKFGKSPVAFLTKLLNDMNWICYIPFKVNYRVEDTEILLLNEVCPTLFNFFVALMPYHLGNYNYYYYYYHTLFT